MDYRRTPMAEDEFQFMAVDKVTETLHTSLQGLTPEEVKSKGHAMAQMR